MKRALALLLCAVTIIACFTGCAKRAEDDKGAIINAYIATDTFSFDPAFAYTDESAAIYLGMLYQGLTYIDAGGNLKNGMMESYTVTKDEIRNEYKLNISLKASKWTDGRAVTANDFVYAWTRLLDPKFSSPAASLLYDIKNARLAKSGDTSIDNIGISAEDTLLLVVTFTEDVDYKAFLRNCADIALSPLVEDVVKKNPETWSMKYSTLVTNGPFSIKSVDYDKGTMRIERSIYYMLGEDDDLLKYVTPYRFLINFEFGTQRGEDGDQKLEDLTKQLEAYNNAGLQYIGDLSLDARKEYQKKVKAADAGSTLSFMMNTKNPVLSDAKVRTALSMALDRMHIAELLTFAKPATGLINNTVTEGASKKTFRSAGEVLITTGADVEGAKALLSQAGVKSGSFTLTHKLTEADTAVAEYAKSVWESLGFTVTLKGVTGKSEKQTIDGIESVVVYDTLNKAYQTGDYDVIAVDFAMTGADAFATLAQFAKDYSGMSTDDSWAATGHLSGFDDAAYTEIIDRAFAEKDSVKRSVILHEAEKYLIEQMPIIPVVFNQTFYMAIGDISGLRFNYDGTIDFSKLNLKNYLSYITEE